MWAPSVKKHSKTPVTPCGRDFCGLSYFVGNICRQSLSVTPLSRDISTQRRGEGYPGYRHKTEGTQCAHAQTEEQEMRARDEISAPKTLNPRRTKEQRL